MPATLDRTAAPGQAPATAPKPTFLLGLDLGQASDYSALCIVEKTARPDPEHPNDPRRRLHEYGVRHLHRWELGTPYTTIVSDVSELAHQPVLLNATMALDATGIGRPVAELFLMARLPLWVRPITITFGGSSAPQDDGGWTVPKKDLVGTMQTLVQARRFHIAPGLKHAPTLGRELQMFRVKVNPLTGNETFEAWREREHDDMVLAVALACWLGEHYTPCFPTEALPEPPRRPLPGEPGWTADGAAARRRFGRRF